MLLAAIVILAIILAAVLAVAATRPDTFRIERSVRIEAPPERVHPLIDDLRRWTAWSPWEGLDPALKRSYSGPASGAGAAYAWEGNRKVGSGRMEIMQSQPPGSVVLKLDFLRPFEAHNVAEFRLDRQGAGTELVWAMHGPSPFAARLMGLFFSMDRMVGPQFEKGLANLKALAERADAQ